MAEEKKQEIVKIMVTDSAGWNRYGNKIKFGEKVDLTLEQYEDIKHLLKHKLLK
jgi:hypothetical protein